MRPLRAIALATICAACKAAPPPGAVSVGLLSVSDANLAGNPELPESAAQVRRELQNALESTGHFVVREGGEARVRLEIDRPAGCWRPRRTSPRARSRPSARWPTWR